MTITMYQASVPVLARAMRNLAHVLEVGATHMRAEGLDVDSILELRLVEDMLPLVRQVQIATDMAKNGAARLAGEVPEAIADDETTYAQLQARIARVIEICTGFEPAQIDGSESRVIVLPRTAAGELTFDGTTYLTAFVMPNLYFHITMTYALLRQAGVPLGKLDFAGMPKR